MFKWLKEMGGLSAMAERNKEKAAILYDYLDQSKLFRGTARKEDRSLMNVPFVTGSDELDALFVAEAKSMASSPSRATAPWAACARASTTPCRRPVSRRSSPSMAEFEKNNG